MNSAPPPQQPRPPAGPGVPPQPGTVGRQQPKPPASHPAEQRRRPARQGALRRYLADLRALRSTTPGRFTMLGATIALLSVIAGLFGFFAVQTKEDGLNDLVLRSEPLSIAAQDLYSALSDADATVAGAFLVGGGEPLAVRERYEADIAAAADALTAAAHGAGGAGRLSEPVARLSNQLPVYTGLVEAARANHRQGFPVGAAYLREASGLMQSTMLPAAEELYQSEMARVVTDQDDASGWPIVEVALGVVLLGALAFGQLYVFRRTNRILNIGMVVATVAVVASLAWTGIAQLSMLSSLDESRTEGSAQVDVLARARIAALQARSGETLTLVAQGSGGSYVKDFDEAAEQLGGTDGSGGLLGEAREMATDPEVRNAVDAAIEQNQTWMSLHAEIRSHDEAGSFDDAVELTTTTANEAFSEVDRNLMTALDAVRDTMVARSADAHGALGGLAIGMLACSLIAAVGAGAGIWQRVREYR
ncbi:hypothetical protein [Actinoalloteichus hymeniacidonis]|uniref:Chemotaxis methyl-accepting receptor HlyB-like 4HB MCP domain-containing protein n=1 Tax=Actinoalloteichus hymeniacidonis TaxID=340345 RepID=A0AAC9MXA3_9PSEU|nr:hypothetical protein [Actinoalloteichus hymeniacidonis]AOS63013.1 hypothetical protein TL08_10995 [Actinoalloteichus hymeniacidonis]MBB5908952.1 hypothetical protein [Actinoalloteichus hymeniacidonis]